MGYDPLWRDLESVYQSAGQLHSDATDWTYKRTTWPARIYLGKYYGTSSSAMCVTGIDRKLI